MHPEDIDEAWVRRAAAALALDLGAEHVPGVILYYRIIAEHAALLNGFALDESAENAAVFTPCSPPTPA